MSCFSKGEGSWIGDAGFMVMRRGRCFGGLVDDLLKLASCIRVRVLRWVMVGGFLMVLMRLWAGLGSDGAEE